MMIIAALAAATALQADAGWSRMADVPAPAIYSSASDGPGTLLMCQNGKFGLMVALEDRSFESILQDPSKRMRELRGKLKVDGEETYQGIFAYKPSAKAAQASERKPAAQVFNAIVRGQSVELSLASKGTSLLSLPAVDDVFRTFAAECQAQRKA